MRGCPGGSAAAFLASLRWSAGLWGFVSALTAFTNARWPFAVVTRAATPGEKPPGWVTASVTGAPSSCATASRTGWGRASQGVRTPAAGGAVGVMSRMVRGRLGFAPAVFRPLRPGSAPSRRLGTTRAPPRLKAPLAVWTASSSGNAGRAEAAGGASVTRPLTPPASATTGPAPAPSADAPSARPPAGPAAARTPDSGMLTSRCADEFLAEGQLAQDARAPHR